MRNGRKPVSHSIEQRLDIIEKRLNGWDPKGPRFDDLNKRDLKWLVGATRRVLAVAFGLKMEEDNLDVDDTVLSNEERTRLLRIGQSILDAIDDRIYSNRN